MPSSIIMATGEEREQKIKNSPYQKEHLV